MDQIYQPGGDSRSSTASGGHEAEIRLPGVRQLLLPHSLVPSRLYNSTQEALSEQGRPLPRITPSSFPETSSSPPNRASESGIRSQRSDQSESIFWRCQSREVSNTDTRAAENHKVYHFVRNSPQEYGQTSHLQRALLSPSSHPYSVAQPHQAGFSSLGSSQQVGDASHATIVGRYRETRDVFRHFQWPFPANQWHDTPRRPNWGTTKAGKPRKRLAQACLSCRHKKIRCHPNAYSRKCHQCERTDGDCKYESGSRQSQSTAVSHDDASEAPILSPNAILESRTSVETSGDDDMTKAHDQARSRCVGSERPPSAVSPPSMASADDGVRPLKRQKRDLDPAQDRPNTLQTTPSPPQLSDALSPPANAPPPFDMTDTLGLAGADWNLDPFPISPLTMEYLELYFTHINQATYSMLPKCPFLDWVRDCDHKTLDDKMVIYGLMAMGCRFSAHKESTAHGKRLLQIARFAEQSSFGKFTLQLVQTRLILALLHFSLGNSSEAWDYCGTAIRAACGLKYNTEAGVVDHQQLEDCEYGLNRSTLAECRRRTFWSAYIMDRFCGFCSGHLSMLHNRDCFLRLPCREDLYEDQDPPTTPYFSSIDQDLDRQEQVSLGNMAYLIAISSTWSDVLQNIYRTKHRLVSGEKGMYETFYQERQRQLQTFTDRLPPHLFPCTTQNIERALQGGYIGTFISLHTLYHTTHMKLNRHALLDELPEEALGRNLRAARYHAREALTVSHTISELHRSQSSSELAWIFSTPFQGYSTLSAVDILTSIGSLVELKSDLQLVQSSLEVVQELSKYWASAQKQLKMIAVRLEEMMRALERASADHAVSVTTVPMEDISGKELDLFFSAPVEARLRALGLGTVTTEGQGLLVIESLDLDSKTLRW